jgi:hypothetical protein
MISIARELDAHDIAQEIRQERQVHRGSFLLLEGDRDIKRFTKFVDENASSIQNCFGRDNLIGAMEILIGEGFPGVLGLASANFDRIEGCLPNNDAIIFSEFHDFDLDVAMSDVLRRYLEEVGDSEKCLALGGHKGVRERLLEVCKPLSVLRHLNHTLELGYRLDQIAHVEICAGWLVDADLLVARVSSDQSTNEQEQSIKQMLLNHAAQDFDFQQITSGQDFLAILGIGLQDELGDRKPPQTLVSEVGIHFRLAFSTDDFIRTPLYFAILNWESENVPYVILKGTLRRAPPRVLH